MNTEGILVESGIKYQPPESKELPLIRELRCRIEEEKARAAKWEMAYYDLQREYDEYRTIYPKEASV